jgi:hypothetical protein
MTPIPVLADQHGFSTPIWRVVARMRCSGLDRPGETCGGKPDLVTLVRGQERRKDFKILAEITVLDNRMCNSD